MADKFSGAQRGGYIRINTEFQKGFFRGKSCEENLEKNDGGQNNLQGSGRRRVRKRKSSL
jgi:hypothetical protein